MSNLLEGKTILVMGVANKRSIAWGCAQEMQENGAKLIYTYQNERLKKSLMRLVDDENLLIECDVASDESIKEAFNFTVYHLMLNMSAHFVCLQAFIVFNRHFLHLAHKLFPEAS